MLPAALIRNGLIAAIIFQAGSLGALSQVPDRVDPTTGNYIPGIDPFNATAKASNSDSPFRINKRISKRVGSALGQDAPAPYVRTPADKGLATDASSNSTTQYPSWWPH